MTWPYTERPSTPQGNQCLLTHFLASLGTQEKTNGTLMLWSIDSYQNRVSAGRHHLQVGVTPSQGGNPRTYAGMARCLSTLFVNFKPGIWDSRECSAATILQMYNMWSLIRASPQCLWSATFPKMIGYFVEKKNTLNNERYSDLLIRILSYDEVSAFLLWVFGFSWILDFCGTVNYMVMFT